MTFSLFAYGTLMAEEIISLVVGRPLSNAPATLAGYRRNLLRDEVYPAIRPDPDQAVAGALYTHLSHRDMQRLDLFEGEMYLRQTIRVELSDGCSTGAETYVLRPAYYRRLTDRPWDLREFLSEGRELFVAEYAGVTRIRDDQGS